MNSPRTTARTLGSVRASKGSILPPLTHALSESNKVYFQDHQLRVTGDAVHTSLRWGEDHSTRGSTSRPMLSRLDTGSKICEELQTKESQQKNKIGSLHKSIEQLKSEVKAKEEEYNSIQAKFQVMEERYRILYEEEKSAHSKTQEYLATTRDELAQKINFVEELKLKHDQKVTEYESRLHIIQEEKDKEIAERDQRIHKLKTQMADVLKDNSWERQQQLEGLSKEFTKVLGETNMLRMKLKSLRTKKDCDECRRLRCVLEHENKKILEKDKVIKQMKVLCNKFETQLNNQDILLKQFADSNGHKVYYDPTK